MRNLSIALIFIASCVLTFLMDGNFWPMVLGYLFVCTHVEAEETSTKEESR